MNGVKRCEIAELKSLAAPPVAVKEVLSVVLLILGYSERDSQDWKVAQKALANPDEFLTKLINCDVSRASPENIEKAKTMLDKLEPASVMKVSLAAAGMSGWARAIVSQ